MEPVTDGVPAYEVVWSTSAKFLARHAAAATPTVDALVAIAIDALRTSGRPVNHPIRVLVGRRRARLTFGRLVGVKARGSWYEVLVDRKTSQVVSVKQVGLRRHPDKTNAT